MTGECSFPSEQVLQDGPLRNPRENERNEYAKANTEQQVHLGNTDAEGTYQNHPGKDRRERVDQVNLQ
jgi:hypothetical protein